LAHCLRASRAFLVKRMASHGPICHAAPPCIPYVGLTCVRRMRVRHILLRVHRPQMSYGHARVAFFEDSILFC
jgi:hypothetical protein